MTKIMKKKDRERYQLELFRAIFPDFSKGAIIDGNDDGTEPDFFVEQPNALLGNPGQNGASICSGR